MLIIFNKRFHASPRGGSNLLPYRDTQVRWSIRIEVFFCMPQGAERDEDASFYPYWSLIGSIKPAKRYAGLIGMDMRVGTDSLTDQQAGTAPHAFNGTPFIANHSGLGTTAGEGGLLNVCDFFGSIFAAFIASITKSKN